MLDSLKRRMARECALKTLFMVDIGDNDYGGALNYVLEEAKDLSHKEKSFCRRLVNGVMEKREELDRMLTGYLVNWQFDRLAATVRNILRLALFEMLFLDEIPAVVSINEAIEMTKTYQDDESSRFVNGILDKMKTDMVAGKEKK
jgi:N utilization substance protein B